MCWKSELKMNSLPSGCIVLMMTEIKHCICVFFFFVSIKLLYVFMNICNSFVREIFVPVLQIKKPKSHIKYMIGLELEYRLYG